MRRKKLPKIRTLYKIFSVTVPIDISLFTAAVWKSIYPCWGGCPAVFDDASGKWVFPLTSADHSAGIVFAAIGVIFGIFLVYFPWTLRAENMR